MWRVGREREEGGREKGGEKDKEQGKGRERETLISL